MADPIFAVIADHQRCRAEHEAAFDAAGEVELAHRADGLHAAEAGALRDATSDREMEALEQVLCTVPVTSAGMLAWLDHIAGPAGFGSGKRADTAAVPVQVPGPEGRGVVFSEHPDTGSVLPLPLALNRSPGAGGR